MGSTDAGGFTGYRSHGDGSFSPEQLGSLGRNVVFEDGVLVFHPENVILGADVYIGHRAMLKGYHRNHLRVGDGTWIGQMAFIHAAGGVTIGQRVGVGPGVKIFSSTHEDPGPERPIMDGALRFAAVAIGDGCDIGIGAVIMPGVELGTGVQVGAGAVVTRSFDALAVVAGVPARQIGTRERTGS